MVKVLGKGDYKIELSFYAHGEWHKRIYCKRTLKGAYILARVIQHNFNGSLYHFSLSDGKQVRWFYIGETNTSRWCDRLALRENDFTSISNYTSLARG